MIPLQAQTAAQVREVLGAGFSHEMALRVTNTLDVDVLVLDIDGDAYTMRMPEGNVIIVKRTTSWFRQNFSLAHELGHIVLGHMHQQNRGGEEEKAANVFAADLLMPADIIVALNWQTTDLEAVAQLVWDLGVSTDALAHRLMFLGIKASDEISKALTGNTFTLLRRHWTGRDARPDPITQRRDAASTRMVPAGLLSALEKAVLAGRAPAESLAWTMGVAVEDLELPEPDGSDDEDVIALLDELS